MKLETHQYTDRQNKATPIDAARPPGRPPGCIFSDMQRRPDLPPIANSRREIQKLHPDTFSAEMHNLPCIQIDGTRSDQSVPRRAAIFTVETGEFLVSGPRP
ncbi:hypothetical protein GWI33_021123 [Rhynchophorus ferrugineus]|uniref:Uncharacterized protein n=1 Tax=Rhynchophorus ferrugineus TaxID=354439 RepID=A0A834LZW8_RHYFE|nr:hypothetical protein GWI33_021123 [Rhynchophorus ferrugineus]